MTITYATGVGGYSARRFVCTHNDPLCSDSAVVIVLEDGRWYGDALCADHAPKSALRPHAAAEAGKGNPPPPPAATEGQGAVHPSAAPAPGGPPVWRLVCADGSCLAVFFDRDAAVRAGEHVDASLRCGPHTVEPCE